MASFLKEVSRLTDQQLRTKLNSLGEAVGPIVPNLRPLFENRLVKYFIGEKNNEEKSDPDSSAQNAISKEADSDVKCDEESRPLPLSLSRKQPETEFNVNEVDNHLDSSDGTTKKKTVVLTDNNTTAAESVVYYGVGLPEDAQIETDKLVFTDKAEVMKLIKKIKGARFKCFPTFEEADMFSKEAQACLIAAACSPPPKRSDKNQSVIVDNSGIAAESSLFKAPRIQELVKLRKAIEAGDHDTVHNLIWCNPRYLVSSGDTPTILQEGFRYNALHIAAMKNQPEICGTVIDTLEDPKFMELLYPQETDESRLNRIDFIVDLYLNTPDKGNCESALHFASKFGNVEVVSILASHPKTDKIRLNKYRESPAEVTCTRAKNQSQEFQQQILELLEEHYFVPLFRTTENIIQPVIGEAWSPDIQHSQSQQLPGSPMPESPKDPAFAIKAYAGPMSPNQAEKFRKEWSMPPRGRSPGAKWHHDVKRSDNCKGMERIGRKLATDMKIPWTEYWEFLECFTDLTSLKGLEKLEIYLKEKAISVAIEETLSKETPVGEDDEETDSPIRGKLNFSDGDIDLISSKFGTLSLNSPISSPPQNGTNGSEEEERTTLGIENGAGEGAGPTFDEDNTVVKEHGHNDSIKELVEENEDERAEEAVDLSDGVNFTPDRRRRACFITGLHPSKLDMDVLHAIEGVPIRAEKYPAVCRWKALVLSYASDVRKSWPSPGVLERRLTRTAPGPRRSIPMHLQIRPSPLSERIQPLGNLQGNKDRQVKLREVQKNLMAKFME